jgi:hypothetical protein
MSLPKSAAVLSLALVTASLMAQTGTQMRDDPPPDLKKLTEQVEQLAETREKQRIAYLESVRQQVLNALQGSGNAGNYMIECMREIRFGGRKGGNTEYNDWKKENRDLFTNSQFEKAATLHLKYLLLTLERGTKESSEPMMKKVWAHLAELDDAKDLLGVIDRPKRETKIRVVDENQDVVNEIVGDITSLQQPNVHGRSGPGEIRQYVEQMLNSPVDNGFPGQALKLSGRLGPFENWAMSPGDFSAIIEQNIRPILRESRDAKTLLWSWDYEIAYLRAITQKRKNEREITEFETVTLPRMLWKQARDAALVGMPNKALAMQIDIARRFPGHNDFEAWTDAIESSLAVIAAEKDADESLSAEDSKYEDKYETSRPGYFGSAKNSIESAPTPRPLP